MKDLPENIKKNKIPKFSLPPASYVNVAAQNIYFANAKINIFTLFFSFLMSIVTDGVTDSVFF